MAQSLKKKKKKYIPLSIDVFETTLLNVNNKEMLECISSYDNERIDPILEDTHYEDFKFPTILLHKLYETS